MRAKFRLGELVYLSTDRDQVKRMICEIRFLMGGTVTYFLTAGESGCISYEDEITREKTFVI